MLNFLKSRKEALARALQRRLHHRHRTRLRPARLAGLDNEFICDCTIRDVSSGGLRLALNEGTGLPEEFYVFDTVAGTVAQVELRWRDGPAAGVVYLVSPANIRHFSNTGIRKLAQKLYAMDE